MNKLENRTERFHYKGSLEEYQLKMQNKGKYQSITYSSYQNYLYKRALYGIGALNEVGVSLSSNVLSNCSAIMFYTFLLCLLYFLVV